MAIIDQKATCPVWVITNNSNTIITIEKMPNVLPGTDFPSIKAAILISKNMKYGAAMVNVKSPPI